MTLVIDRTRDRTKMCIMPYHPGNRQDMGQNVDVKMPYDPGKRQDKGQNSDAYNAL